MGKDLNTKLYFQNRMKVFSINHYLMDGVDFFTKHTKIQNGLSLKRNAINTMLAILLLGLPKITANSHTGSTNPRGAASYTARTAALGLGLITD